MLLVSGLIGFCVVFRRRKQIELPKSAQQTQGPGLGSDVEGSYTFFLDR